MKTLSLLTHAIVWRGALRCASLLRRAFCIASILAVFCGVARAAPDDGGPVIADAPVVDAMLGKSVTIRATIEDEDGVFAPSVYVRTVGSTQYLNIPMHPAASSSSPSSSQAAKSGVFEATIPGEVVLGDLEYFIEAFDVEGNGPSQRGTPQVPLHIVVNDEASSSGTPESDSPESEDGQAPVDGLASDVDELPRVRPREAAPGDLANPVVGGALTGRDPGRASEDEDDGVAGRWWFWTLVAVAVTGGTVAAVVLASGHEDPLDRVVLRVGGPDPTAGL